MSTIKSITEAVIYTHNNGDETVYIKDSGDKQHTLANDSPRGFDLRAQLMEDQLWGNIRRAAKKNPTLQRALDEAILLYQLSK
jgi:hypothetical protein